MANLLTQNNSLRVRIEGYHLGSALFYITLAAFFLSTAAYGGLLTLNRAQQDAVNEIVEQVAAKEKNIRPELLNEIFSLEKRLKNLRTLLSEHAFSSNVFSLVERDTHPQVHFSSFKLDRGERRVDMTGQTTSYAALSRQIAFFENDPQVERIEFGGLALNERGQVGFKLTVVFTPTLLSIQPQ